MLAPYPAIGYRHLIAGFPAPYDEESMTRLATEVRPALEATERRSPAGAGQAAVGESAFARSRWRAALARLPQVFMLHQRRRPVGEAS